MDDSMKFFEKFREGLIGEKVVREFLIKKENCFFAQLDMIAKIEDLWYSIEVKHQEMFYAPPFNGHGLPVWQINTRLKLHKEKGIIPLFFVLDKRTKKLYYNSLIELEKGDSFITGVKKRVIYPIENFIRLNY